MHLIGYFCSSVVIGLYFERIVVFLGYWYKVFMAAKHISFLGSNEFLTHCTLNQSHSGLFSAQSEIYYFYFFQIRSSWVTVVQMSSNYFILNEFGIQLTRYLVLISWSTKICNTELINYVVFSVSFFLVSKNILCTDFYAMFCPWHVCFSFTGLHLKNARRLWSKQV